MSEKEKYEHVCGHRTRNRAEMWTHLEACPTKGIARELTKKRVTYSQKQLDEQKSALISNLTRAVEGLPMKLVGPQGKPDLYARYLNKASVLALIEGMKP